MISSPERAAYYCPILKQTCPLQYFPIVIM
nr:MAG TPA: hypothetical protein [Caudoviricetes sp.]